MIEVTTSSRGQGMESLLAPLPRLTKQIAGIGGRLKDQVEDFMVEEIPAYAPSGEGDFLYLWIEKRDLSAEFLLKTLAERLQVSKDAIGMAGLKDRRAVTRQWVSVPASATNRLLAVDSADLHILKQSRHSNKLRPGHLHGNRFSILIRDVDVDRLANAPALIQHIRAAGFPNYYGEQRFGRDGETLELGLKLLGGDSPRLRNRFLQKLALSAVQSALFNRHLASRLDDGLLHTVLAGDVMTKHPTGGLFVAKELAAEQARYDRRETTPTGPMFGKKMFAAEGAAHLRELATLERFNLTERSFSGFGKMLQGTRRPLLVMAPDLESEVEGANVRLRFTLPPGAYATVLLDELMKAATDGSIAS